MPASFNWMNKYLKGSTLVFNVLNLSLLLALAERKSDSGYNLARNVPVTVS